MFLCAMYIVQLFLLQQTWFLVKTHQNRQIRQNHQIQHNRENHQLS